MYTLVYDSGDMSGLTDGAPIPTDGGLTLTETDPGGAAEYVILTGGLRRPVVAQGIGNRLQLTASGVPVSHPRSKVVLHFSLTGFGEATGQADSLGAYGMSNYGAGGWCFYGGQRGYHLGGGSSLNTGSMGFASGVTLADSYEIEDSYVEGDPSILTFAMDDTGPIGYSLDVDGTTGSGNAASGNEPASGAAGLFITGTSITAPGALITRVQIYVSDGPLILTAPAGYGSVSVSTVTVPGPKKAGGLGADVAYDWLYVSDMKSLAGVPISGQSGTISDAATDVPDLTWDVDRRYWQIPLWVFCSLSDGTTDYHAVGPLEFDGTIYSVLGDGGCYVPIWAPAVTPLDDSALIAIFNWGRIPAGKKVIFAFIGDSITANETSDLTARLTAISGGTSKWQLINAGHSASLILDWLPGAAATGTGQSVLPGQSGNNNYVGLQNVVFASQNTGDIVVFPICLGTNDSVEPVDTDMADFITLLGDLDTDYLNINGAGTGNPPLIISDEIYRFGGLNDIQLPRLDHIGQFHEIVDASPTDGRFPGDRIATGYFVTHEDQMDGSLHPAAGAGRDALARLWLQVILPVVSRVWPPLVHPVARSI